MDLRFWRNKQNNPVVEELRLMREERQFFQESMNDLTTQCLEQKEEIRKLARLQYRANQDASQKYESLVLEVTKVQQLYQEQLGARQWQELATAQWQTAVNGIIRLLDDLDLAISHNKEGQDAWSQLLLNWATYSLSLLKDLGVTEISAVGQIFEPRLMDATGTINRTEIEASGETVFAPYSVVEVIKRGFVTKNGEMVRKTQVITLEEDLDEIKNSSYCRN